MEKYDFEGPFLQKALYAALKALEEAADGFNFFDLIDFDNADISETELRIWYSEYEEYLRKDQENIKEAALSKLTPQERRALGF